MAQKTRCEWCSRHIEDEQRTGRRKRYCSASCKQRAYEKRKLMRGDGLIAIGEDTVVIGRAELESLQDRLYVLRSAIEVLQGAVDDQAPTDEMISIAREVIAATGDLDRLWVSP